MRVRLDSVAAPTSIISGRSFFVVWANRDGWRICILVVSHTFSEVADKTRCMKSTPGRQKESHVSMLPILKSHEILGCGRSTCIS